ncbi:MAG: tyrosine--tRNA ligase [Proteobacteria bacterium]|nr:tyrosine--tRNA ligase [Pseudomonadota bacterium]
MFESQTLDQITLRQITKIKTMISELTKQGLIAQVTHPEELEHHLEQKKRGCYLGIDPTAPSLHVGHLVTLRLAKKLQQAGHKIIIVLGSATALIGDPSGKSQVRNTLDPSFIASNITSLKQQLPRWLDFSEPSRGEILLNSHWINNISYLDFLQDVARHFSVNRMLTAECYKHRLSTGLSFLEFNYMLLQSYDFYHLFRHHNVSVQLGGDDQWSNMLGGVDLIRRTVSGQAYALTTPLLVNQHGEKMGKTQQGALWLDAEKTPIFDFFQYWRNIDDPSVVPCFKLLTDHDTKSIESLSSTELSEQINSYKILLATLITSSVFGEEATKKVRDATSTLYQKIKQGETKTLLPADVDTIRKITPPLILPSSHINDQKDVSIGELLVIAKVVNSKKEARRLIDQGGLEISGVPCNDPTTRVSCQDIRTKGVLIKKGKKSYYLLKFS